MKARDTAAASALIGAAIALFGAAPQGVSAPAGTVTVHRAAAVDAVRFAGPGGASVQEVEVVRGPARLPTAARFGETEAPAPGRYAVAGGRVWFVDRDRDRLMACYLRDSMQVGHRVIRCTSRRLPE